MKFSACRKSSNKHAHATLETVKLKYYLNRGTVKFFPDKTDSPKTYRHTIGRRLNDEFMVKAWLLAGDRLQDERQIHHELNHLAPSKELPPVETSMRPAELFCY